MWEITGNIIDLLFIVLIVWRFHSLDRFQDEIKCHINELDTKTEQTNKDVEVLVKHLNKDE
jgi:hypothetical protein